jgi:hypothetical protein
MDKNKKMMIIAIVVVLILSSISAAIATFWYDGNETNTDTTTVVLPDLELEYEEEDETIPDGSGGLLPEIIEEEKESDEPLLPSEPECTVYLYRHAGFTDEILKLKNGEHTNLTNLDKVSSVRITGNNRCKVTFFKDPHLRTHDLNYTLRRSEQYPFISDLSRTGAEQESTNVINLNDKVKSMKIWADPSDEDSNLRDTKDNELCEVTLFDGTSNNKFQGASVFRSFPIAVGGEFHDLDTENNFDDNTDGVYLRGKNCTIDMWENHAYTGRTASMTVPSGKYDVYFRLATENNLGRLEHSLPIDGVDYKGQVRQNKMGSYKIRAVP